MAEENHAQVKASIGGQSFEITTKDVISLLLIVMICLAGWFAWQSNEKRLDNFQAQHVLFGKLLLEQKEFAREETEKLYRALVTLQYNIGRPPDEQIPLGLNGLPQGKPPGP